VEVSQHPNSLFHPRQGFPTIVNEELTPEKSKIKKNSNLETSRPLLARLLCQLGFISTVMKFAVEQLHRDNSENKLEESVDNQNVQDIFQRVDHAIEDCLQLWNTVDGFQRPKHAQHTQRLDSAEVFGFGSLITAHKNITKTVSQVTLR
jgi:hypothetical protein